MIMKLVSDDPLAPPPVMSKFASMSLHEVASFAGGSRSAGIDPKTAKKVLITLQVRPPHDLPVLISDSVADIRHRGCRWPVRPRMTAGKPGKVTTGKNASKEATPAKKTKVMRAPLLWPRRGR